MMPPLRYRSLGWPTPALSFDRCGVLLAAGLARDALAEADAAIGEIEQTRGSSTKRAELLLMAASCALAAAQPKVALERARAAYRSVPFPAERLGASSRQARRDSGSVRRGSGIGAPARGGQRSERPPECAGLGGGNAGPACWLAGWRCVSVGAPDADRHLRRGRVKQTSRPGNVASRGMAGGGTARRGCGRLPTVADRVPARP